MLKRISLSLLIIAGIISLSIAGSGPNMKPGKWEITSTVDMPGMPAGMIPPTKIIQCMTKSDMVPQASPESGKCKAPKVKKKGNTVSWTIVCKNQGVTSKMKGSITFKGTTFKGKMIIDTGNKQQPKITTNMSGRRLGACK